MIAERFDRRRPLRTASPVVLLVGAACCGCTADDSGDARPLVLVVSGDTAGWIVPCGCAANQSGGLPRRGTYLKQLAQRANVIVADAGGAPQGTSAYDRAKFEAVLRGESAMHVAAHNIGAAEAELGAAYLRKLARRLDVPLLSANACGKDGQLVAEPVRIVEAGGQRVALVGVLDPRYATDQVSVTPPRQAILDVVRQTAGRRDWLVILAYMPDGALRQLAETLPEADLIVGGPTGQPIRPERVGPALLASATHQGKFLARFDAPNPESGGRWKGTIVELDERFADDPAQVANLQRYYDDLARRDFTPQQTSLVGPLQEHLPQSYQIAGTESCRSCHQEEYNAWDASRHARAWQSLNEKGAHVDPGCQRCHTTGYGLPGGFTSAKRSATLANAGCESCHGPSQAHARDEKVRTAHFAGAADHCRKCHDRENSPHFDFDEYWAKIRHGVPRRERRGPELQLEETP